MYLKLDFDSKLFTELGLNLVAICQKVKFEISVPPALPSQLSYDEYTDCTLSVGR